jgi:hypothetical protein
LIVGNYGYTGFIFNPATSERLFFDVGGANTIARDINAAGDVVGSFFTASGSESYVRYQDGSVDTFSLPGEAETHVMGTNDLGDLVGFTRGDGETGFLIFGAIPPPPLVVPEPNYCPSWPRPRRTRLLAPQAVADFRN